MGGAARTVSKWVPKEIGKAIPKEISKAIPREIAPAMMVAAPFLGLPGLLSLGVVGGALNSAQQRDVNDSAAAADAQAKAASDAQAKQLYDIQHPNIVGQVTMGGAAGSSDPTLTASQNIGPMSTSDASPTTFSAPASMTKATKNAPVYNKPGGAGAALAQQAQDQSNFRLPSVSGLTFGGS